ncbi:3-deoxy-D-manno-octulosonic acid transferase [Hymenobacter sp. BT175]|uniref:3-deoxy-D-manno-octulosonic acid transferase n=1 Tax=Hymenobacter translucens TaxID=2886507 RepID=UPI001D0EEB67|nr:glycosyltransferase N-terminal domain-containing protein [Hymenobacter translucens]MCC2545088.1 3-deoxy-D-manno-octulosonic acid transferase [Hymenobacter translucens]
MLFLYNIGVRLYALLLQLVAPFVPKARQWADGRRNLLTHIRQELAGQAAPRVWFHCASLGEFEQGRPLLEAFAARYPDYQIVLTFFSPSGYEIRKNWPGAAYVFYLPLDTAANARQFLELVQPRLAVFVKYEFWYHFLTQLQQRGIPAISVSAIFRPEQAFFKPWGSLFRRILGGFAHIFTQNEASAALLHTAGIGQVSVAGDTRFDTVLRTAAAPPRDLPIVSAFTADQAPVFVIGSSWPEDLPALIPLMQRYQQQMRFIVAPHEVTVENLSLVETALPGQVLRYSAATVSNAAPARVLLMDNVGLLSQLYRFGSYAYIGGAFGKGLHNTLEAAAFGLPLFFGPVYAKFQEAQDLVRLGCAFPITSTAELQAAFEPLWLDAGTRAVIRETSLTYIQQKAGATATIMRWLEKEMMKS